MPTGSPEPSKPPAPKCPELTANAHSSHANAPAHHSCKCFYSCKCPAAMHATSRDRKGAVLKILNNQSHAPHIYLPHRLSLLPPHISPAPKTPCTPQLR